MSDTGSICPQCKRPVSTDSPAGLCPSCLMAMNMATQTLGDEAAGPKPPPPGLEDLARFFPNYELVECLGRGGMGVVYKAIQKSLNRVVALKILAPERKQDEAFARRFTIEAETLARLSHPNIVTIHDFGQAEDMFYLVMEFVDGVTLRQLLHTGRIAPREALAIVPQICDALQYAHDQNIVHRDIKPENIILDRRGRVKVADFGIAKILGEASDSPQGSKASAGAAMTEAGNVIGTPNYMAPEQIEHPEAVDHRADIYALGVVFYQMLTGELPGKRIQPPSKMVHVDVRLDEVVLRALEKDPERRYNQASVFKTNVETIAATPPPTADAARPVVPPAPPVQKAAPRMSKMAVAGALCLLAPIALGTLAALVLGMQGSSGFDLMAARKLAFVGGLPFFPALFLQCIFGWIAVAQIQKSEGRIYGMGLALFDGLLLPLLVLNGFIVAVGAAFRLGIGEGLLIALLIDALLLFWIVPHFASGTETQRGLKLGFAGAAAVVLALTTLFFFFGPGLARNAKSSPHEANSRTGIAFTPLREQVVRDLIDFDTGTLMPLPIAMADKVGDADPRRYAWFNEDKGSFAWMRARGIDAFQGNHGLIGVDMLAVEILPREFDSLRPEEVEPRLTKLGWREVPPSSWIFNNVIGCYAFRTRQGNYGLLRLDPTVSQGVRVWWKMVGNAAGRANTATWASLVTGDTPEQGQVTNPQQYGDIYVLMLSGEGDENKRFIDLDTGKRFAASEFYSEQDEPSPEETRAWWRETGIDALADTSPAVQGIVGFEMVVSPAETSLWTASPERLNYYLELGQPGTPGYMPAKGKLPASFAFKTREGGRGVLQILEISKQPPEIKFQYKLVK